MSVSSVTLNLESRLEAYNLKVVDLIVALNLESKSRFCDIKITDIYRVEYFSRPEIFDALHNSFKFPTLSHKPFRVLSRLATFD